MLPAHDVTDGWNPSAIAIHTAAGGLELDS
jgi:hypothetical protein